MITHYTNFKQNNDQYDLPYNDVNDNDDLEDSNEDQNWAGETNPWQ